MRVGHPLSESARAWRVGRTFLRAICVVAQVASPVSAGWLYLPDPLRSQILVTDSGSGRLVARIPTVEPSRAVLSDPNRGVLYIANTGWITRHSEPSTVWIVRTPVMESGSVDSVGGAFLESLELVGAADVGIGPIALAINPDGTRLYVANNGSDSISVIDTANRSTVATLPLVGRPSAIAYDRKRAALYVTRAEMNALAVMDADTGEIRRSAPVGEWPIDVAYVETLDAVVVANLVSKDLTVIDAKASEMTSTIPLDAAPSRLVAAGAEGAVYVLSNAGSTLARFDGAERRVVTTMATDASPTAIAVDAQSGTLAVSTFADGHLTVLQGVGLDMVQRTPYAAQGGPGR